MAAFLPLRRTRNLRTCSAAPTSRSKIGIARNPPAEKRSSLDPDNSRFHLWLGRVYGEKAERANPLAAAVLAGKVREEFERAVQLNPKDVDARLDLAEFYIEAPGILGGGEQKAREQAQSIATREPWP